MKTYLLFTALLLFGCSESKDTIKIKGSDTEVNLAVRLAEEFYKKDPKYIVSISGGGSGLGIASLLNGEADIANSSRALNRVEDSLFHDRNMQLDTFVFAEDAIAFVVSASCPLDSVTVDELGKILSGAYTNWKQLTGEDLPINIYGRQSNSGTHDFVKQKLKIEFSEHAKEMNGNAQIMEAVKIDKSGIGYVGAGYVLGAATSAGNMVKVLKVAAPGTKAISALDETAILNNQYFFQRPLYQFIRSESAAKVSSFIAFEKSAEGLAIIKASGYYPVNK
ncbi:MAG TPA: substrate-binding domain-containing protein [Panacibacter sp.]|nr:substrate-binding domain-containing protein [Panacibacter sp.]